MTAQLEHYLPLPRQPRGGARPRGVPVASVQGTLALDLEPLHAQELSAAPGPWPVPAPGTSVRVPPSPDPGEVERVAQAFARGLVEVLSGDRGPGQLLRWTSPEVYDELQRRTSLLTRTTPSDRRVRPLRSHLRSVRHSQPRPGAVELTIHLRRGQRSHAVAARLEHRAEHRRGQLRVAWLCTALEVG